MGIYSYGALTCIWCPVTVNAAARVRTERCAEHWSRPYQPGVNSLRPIRPDQCNPGAPDLDLFPPKKTPKLGSGYEDSKRKRLTPHHPSFPLETNTKSVSSHTSRTPKDSRSAIQSPFYRTLKTQLTPLNPASNPLGPP
ncbi:hypothetical protein VTL71DRAFT_682, partial [Oculimacula yallundae]